MVTKIRLCSAVICLFFAFFSINKAFADESFPQKIEWKSNANALEYKVDLQNITTGKMQVITTDKTSAELSLPPARYRYRVHAYDFLGKEASVSPWTNFEVFKANKPKITNIEKTLQVSKDGGSVGISVDISDVNANSKFELVNESLQGAISSADKSKMSESSSETDSITRLDFKNVPPGKWRLRVTNASGLSSLSDVITIDGEKMYNSDEVEKIRFEAEESVRAQMQKDFDDYVKKSEEEKKREIELALSNYEKNREALLAEEKRLEAERLAEEKRLEEEAKEREKQLLREKEAEEKKAKAEEKLRRKMEKKNQPYKWKDVIFEGGLAATFRLYDSDFKEFYKETYSPALNIRAMILPVKRKSGKFGFELCYLGQKFSNETEFLEAGLTAQVFDAKMVWQYELVKSLFIQLKAGGGVTMLNKEIEYISTVYENRSAPEEKTYFYPTASGNLSIFCNVLKFVVMEAGVEYNHVFTNSSSLGMISPYACLGVRF